MTIQFYTKQLGKSESILHINHVNRTIQIAQRKKNLYSVKYIMEKYNILHQVTVLPSKLNDICITTVINVRTLIESDYV